MSRLLDGARARERAALIDTPRYDLEVDVTNPERFSVSATVAFGCRRPGATTFADCELQVAAAWLNGTAIAGPIDGRLELPGLAARNELRVEATGRYDPAARGLGRVADDDGDAYVYTLLEPCFAHRVLPCFDQPDLGGAVTLTLVAPRGWTATSTGPLSARTVTGAGAVRWSFAPTPPLPLYAFAFAAGPFHEQRAGSELGLLCRRSVADRLDADALLELGRAGIAALEDITGVAYPFAKLDQVFVPGFAGALEGAGCVLLTEDFLLAGDADPVRRQTRAATILHEIAHMWFGNLVTIRWWDELWLKEALATHFGLVATEAVTGSRAAWHLLALRHEAEARMLDELSVSHPVAVVEDDLQRAVDGYDAITYFKGAAAIRQLEAQVGADATRSALSTWLTAHARRAADPATLREELERAAGAPLDGFYESWLLRAGTGGVSMDVETDALDLVTSARVEQTGAVRAQRLRVGAYDLVDGRLEARETPELLLDEAAELDFLVGRPRPAALLADPECVAYVDRRLDPQSAQALLEHIATLADASAQAAAWNALWDGVRHGSLPPHAFARAARTQLGSEADPAIVELVLGRAVEALETYARPHEIHGEGGALAEHAQIRTDDPNLAASTRAAWLETFVALSTDVDQLAALLAAELAPAARLAVLIRLSALGGALPPAGLDGAQAAAVAAAAPDRRAKETAWERIAATGQPVATIQLVARGFHQSSQVELVEPYASRYAHELPAISERLPWEIARIVAAELFPRAVVRDKALDAVEGLLATEDLPAGLRRIVRERRDRLARILGARAVASPR